MFKLFLLKHFSFNLKPSLINVKFSFKNFFFYFNFFYFYENKFKLVNFNKNYLNVFSKNNYTFTSSLINYYITNFYFYKNFNKNYLFNFKNNSYHGNKLFYVLKKKKKYFNSDFLGFYSNFNNSYKKIKNFKIVKQNLAFIGYIYMFEDFNFYINKQKYNFYTKNIYFYSRFNLLNFNFNLFFFNFFRKGNTKIFFKNLFSKKFFLKKDFNFNKLKFFNFNKSNTYFYKNPPFNLTFFLNFSIYKSNFKKFFLFLFFRNYLTIKNVFNVNNKLNFNFEYYKKNIKNIFLNINYLNDIFDKNNFLSRNNFTLVNSFFFLKILKVMNNSISKEKFFKNNFNFFYYNNYYPVLYSNNTVISRFFSKFKINFNVNYFIYFNFYIISFLELFLKKNIFLKISNNFFNKIKKNNQLYSTYLNYKNYQPKYFKNFLIIDFLDLLWYSLYLKDLNLISSWICQLLESIHFKFHRKFILFFQNFVNKHERIFYDIFNLKGFFFDIRGKVGVTGNSKKRHFFFKIGKINKSTKKRKIEFKQSLVRTPSGVLGLTFILSY